MVRSRVTRKVALAAAAKALGQGHVRPVGRRFGGSRTDLWRVRAEDGRALVVKSYRDPGSNTWRREAAGLAAVAGAAVPELVALVEDPAVVVMGDLGPGQSLADHLFGRDRGAAVVALHAWARALGELHARGPERVEAFAAHLGQDLPVSVMAEELDRLPELLAGLTEEHGLPGPPDLSDLVAVAGERLGDPARHVVTPGDTCPDNNLVDNRVDGAVAHLLDFEFAEARHPAWDAAYLRVPWPTCWCAWQLPPALADDALTTYRRATGVDWINDDEFLGDVEAATLLWCLVSSTMFLSDALSDGADGGNRRRPGRRTMILHRLGLAASLPGPAALTAYAGQLAADLTRRWGPHPLAMAPALDR